MASRRRVLALAVNSSVTLLAGGLMVLLAPRKTPSSRLDCRGSASNADEIKWQPIGDQSVAPPRYPLSAEKGRHYLADANDQPFLIVGDACWSLLAQLTYEDAEFYLEDRRKRGFNTLLVNLIEHRYADKAPRNVYGESPFSAVGDLSTPNPLYFDHTERVLRLAAQKGFLVLLAPAYTGVDGGPDGWYQEMVVSGPEKLRAYGVYVGGRFKDFTNIIWVNNCDFNPPRRDVVQAVADGIRSMMPRALQVAHNAPETSGIEFWPINELPMQVDTIYTYKPVVWTALRLWAKKSLPYFLIESRYENEDDGTALRVRAQAWQAMLTGAAGQVFGNNPIWHFNASIRGSQRINWRQALDGPGSRSMVHLRNLLLSMPWWRLDPDTDGKLLKGGALSGQNRAVAACTADGELAVVYLPTSRALSIDMRQLAGTYVIARWLDPAEGRFLDAHAAPLSTATPLEIDVPGCSAEGDWVLVLSKAPA